MDPDQLWSEILSIAELNTEAVEDLEVEGDDCGDYAALALEKLSRKILQFGNWMHRGGFPPAWKQHPCEG